jgi:hypothetical protein
MDSLHAVMMVISTRQHDIVDYDSVLFSSKSSENLPTNLREVDDVIIVVGGDEFDFVGEMRTIVWYITSHNESSRPKVPFTKFDFCVFSTQYSSAL